MKTRIFISLIFCITWLASITQTTIPGGNVAGVWELSGSPYLIEGDIIITDGDILEIEAGVVVEFQGHYRFRNYGQLLAIGNEIDSIKFTALNKIEGWVHMTIDSDPINNDTTILEYCIIEYGNANGGPEPDDNIGGGLVASYAKLRISHCLIQNNSCSGDAPWGSPYGGGIYLALIDAVIEYNTIVNNTSEEEGGGIFIGDCNNPILRRNIIAYNECTNPNQSSGMVIYQNSNPTLINNTIANNYKGGVSIEVNCAPVFINTIIWGNTMTSGSNVHILDEGSCPIFFYCDIEEGFDGFTGEGSGNNFCGVYENCIDENPEFEDPEYGDFYLTEDSECIDAGDPEYPYDPDNTVCDIGALFYDQLTAINENFNQTNAMISCYPNPVINKTAIEFEIPRTGFVSIRIYDIYGNANGTLKSEYLLAGKHQIEWNTEGLPVGIYFVKIETGSSTRGLKILKTK